MAIRKITDPYYGRGVSIGMGNSAVEITAGVSDKLIGFSLVVSPPFDTHKINAGDDSLRGFLELGLKVSLAWLTFYISIHRWSENQPNFTLKGFGLE